MRYAKLRGKIKEVFDTQAAFSEAMEMSPSALSMRLTGSVQWTLCEAERAITLLGLSHSDIGTYFFGEKVDKNIVRGNGGQHDGDCHGSRCG